MVDVLDIQQLSGAFAAGLPAGVPARARVAHKTGEISTVAHDAGIVYLPDRDPYVVVILTEWAAGSDSVKRRSAGDGRARLAHRGRVHDGARVMEAQRFPLPLVDGRRPAAEVPPGAAARRALHRRREGRGAAAAALLPAGGLLATATELELAPNFKL